MCKLSPIHSFGAWDKNTELGVTGQPVTALNMVRHLCPKTSSPSVPLSHVDAGLCSCDLEQRVNGGCSASGCQGRHHPASCALRACSQQEGSSGKGTGHWAESCVCQRCLPNSNWDCWFFQKTLTLFVFILSIKPMFLMEISALLDFLP